MLKEVPGSRLTEKMKEKSHEKKGKTRACS
jgi:hypothetical protein